MFDAVRIRLLEIGEAVKAISPSLLATERAIRWKNIAAMRDQLAHRYFDTEHAVVSGAVTEDLDPLLAAVHRPRPRARPPSHLGAKEQVSPA